MKKVEVSRGLLIGLVATCAAAVLAMAFLLGRESSRPRPVPALAAPAPDLPATAPPADPAGPEPAPFLPAPAGETPRPRPVPPAATVPPGAAVDPVRTAVASYFQAIDRIQPGQLGADPEAMAKGIIEGLGKGDTSGIDGMIRQSETVRAKLAALATPAPCVAHHQESLGALDDSLKILQSVRNSMLTSSPSALPQDFASQANQLRERAEKLQQEEKTLRERYGLAH